MPEEEEVVADEQADDDVVVESSDVQQAVKTVEQVEEVAVFVEKALKSRGEVEVTVSHVEKGGLVSEVLADSDYLSLSRYLSFLVFT